MNIRYAVASLLLIAATPRVCRAVAPTTMAFQGVLTDATGKPKPNGTYNLTFKLYDALSGGNLLWTETNKPVAVAGARGLFSTSLGTPTVFGALAFNAPYFVDVQVQGEAASMTPRIPLQAVPYALSTGAANLTLPFAGSLTSASTGIAVTNAGTGHAITADSAGVGVAGAAIVAHSSSATGIGILSDTSSTDGNLVLFQNGTGDLIKGFSAGGSNLGFEVAGNGTVISTGGINGNVANNYGVTGHGTGTAFAGVYGLGDLNGIYGQTYNGAATAVLGRNESTGGGVFGYSVGGDGVQGRTDGDAKNGVSGYTEKANGSGVFGWDNNISTGNGVAGFAVGVGSNGVYGLSNGAGGKGVSGAANATATSRGVNGTAAAGYGVYGSATDSSGTGVYGENAASGSYGWLGSRYSTFDPFPAPGSTIDVPVGVFGSGGAGGVGLMGRGTGGFVAGLFLGEVHVAGAFYANDKHFLIDHPLDPANKFLVHTSVESPDAMNIYNGNVITDASGAVVVSLPDYFGALNKDFRYQLTCIGQFAQAIVSTEIKDNRFTIQTDKPKVKVSWQVTGIRNDAYIKAHPTQVEILKAPAERGRYLDPELFGQPADRALAGVLGHRSEAPVGS